MMDANEKKELYEAYLLDRSRQIKVEIPNGPVLNWNKCWNYKSNLKEVSFNTLMEPEIEHKLMKSEVVDLMPVANVKYWHITVLRQELPEQPTQKKNKDAYNSY